MANASELATKILLETIKTKGLKDSKDESEPNKGLAREVAEMYTIIYEAISNNADDFATVQSILPAEEVERRLEAIKNGS